MASFLFILRPCRDSEMNSMSHKSVFPNTTMHLSGVFSSINVFQDLTLCPVSTGNTASRMFWEKNG